ncbi:MAG: amidohydrolase [Candidatus Bathyarchaeota archaeon]|nr:MAG: amidohydrolase [Candidatus Bathyarchaeota archaeon]
MMSACDIVLVNGKIVTVDPNDRIVEAVAIKTGRIVQVGSNQEIKRLIQSETRVIDLAGKTVLPGFIDAHTHLLSTSTNLTYMVDIHTPPVKTVVDILKRIKAQADKTPKGEWIIGQGNFHLDRKLIDRRYPTKAELDKVAPNHPVVLRGGAHLQILNSNALAQAEIRRDTPDPPGGKVDRNAVGEPTGILREAYGALPIPPYTFDQIREAIKHTSQMIYVKRGITTIHEFLMSTTGMKIYQDLLNHDELPLRLNILVTIPTMVDVDCLVNLGIQTGFGNQWLRISGVKLFVDGGITGVAAAIYRPYLHQQHVGVLKTTQEKLTQRVIKAHKAGLRVCLHAVGDKAFDMALNSLDAALKAKPMQDHRHRIEHAGNILCTLERIERMKELGIIPVPTPPFLYSFGDYIETYLGQKRAKTVFVYKTLLNSGFMPPGNSDCAGAEPESINPLFGIWCAVTRKTFNGNILCLEEKISVKEAIRMYTIYAAYAGFEEKLKGSIEPGKLADLIVLSHDILTVPVDTIKQIEIEMTIINGKIVYQRASP